MNPGYLPLKCKQGQTYTRTLRLKRKVAGVLTPVDLTGYTGKMQIRGSAGDPTLLAEATVTVDGPNGTVTLSLTSAQTTALPPGKLVYDLDITDAAGQNQPLAEGPFRVTAEVTT